MTDQEITQAQMMEKASNIADYYAYTEQQMFYILIDSFKKTRPELMNAEKDPQKIMAVSYTHLTLPTKAWV